MAKATWEGAVLAQSTDTVVVEGNHYFPVESLHRDFFRPSDHTTVCGWKGTACYYDVVVDGKTNRNAAWYYPDPRNTRNAGGKCTRMVHCKPSPGARKSSARLTPTVCA